MSQRLASDHSIENAHRSHRATDAIRSRLVERILATVGTPESFDEYQVPVGDPGLFGPDSVAWIVHRDLPAMLIGGISALMLQTLHPLAMAGVAEHSNFRQDPFGRMHRTARFVAGTTFGPMPLVDRLIAKVQAVHREVNGTANDGRPYSANDPELLTWVHTTEVSSFLHSYEQLGPQTLSAADKDRYLFEVARLARRLGAIDPPTSVADVQAYFDRVQPQLSCTPEAAAALHFLRTPMSKSPLERLAHRVVVAKAVALLPSFARPLLDLHQLPIVTPIGAQTGARVFAGVVHWAIGPSRIATIAEHRVGQS